MALYTQKSYNDIKDDWERIQRLELQRQQEEAANKYNKAAQQAQQAQNSKKGGLEGVLAGIGETIGNVGNSLYNMFGTGAASVRDLFTGNAGTGKYANEWKQYMKESQYGDANMSDKDYYLKTGGKALDAAATVSDFIPGLGAGTRAAMNIGQGAISGAARELIDNGENASLDNALRNALVGAAASGAGQYVGGKIGGIKGTGKLASLAKSNVGRGAIAGATAGAVGGGLGTAMSGGDLGQTLSGALQGAGSGAAGGAAMGGVMGLTGKALDKLNNKITTPKAPKTTPTVEAPDEAITKAAVETADNLPTRKGIAVTDYDAGEQPVKVRRANQPTGEYSLEKNAGSTLDGILGPNNKTKLKNAQTPTDSALIQKATGDADVYEFLRNFSDNGTDTLDALKSVLSPEDYAKVRQGAQDWAALEGLGFDGTNASNKTNLPQLDRQQYYEDTIGKLGNKGNANLSAADVPDYMNSHLKNDAAKAQGYISDNESILRELFNDNQSDLGELYKRYEDLAQSANQNEIYTPENIANGIRMDEDLGKRVTDAVLKEYGMRKQLGVDAYPSLRKPIDVGFEGAPSNETVYTKRTIPAKSQNLPATTQDITPATVEDTPLIQKGSPEYNAIMEQRQIANRQRQYRDTVVGGVLDQYGTTRISDRVNGINDAIMEVADLGLTSRADIDGFANAITGKDGEVSKIIRKSLNKAGKTNGRIGITMEDVYDAVGASEGAKKQIQSFFNSKGKKYAVDVDGNMSRSDMYDFGKELEKQAYKMIDRGDRLQNSQTQEYGQALRILGEEFINQATDGVDIKANINVNKLKNILPGNEKWAAKVDDFANNATTVQDARSFIAAPTKMALLGQAADFNQNTFGANMGNAGRDVGRAIRAGNSANPFIAGAQIAAERIATSDAAKQKAIQNAIKGYQNIEAGGTGQTGVKGAVKNIASKAGQKLSGVGEALNNQTFNNARFGGGFGDNSFPSMGELAMRQIIRQSGNNAQNDVYADQKLQQAQNDALEAQNAYNNAITSYQNAAPQAQAATQGAQQLQTISDAMGRALAAGDIQAYSQLASLYKQAYAIYGGTQNEAKALSANQAKALTAQGQLEKLAQMSPDAGTALANSPLGFLVNLGGGNEYANQAKSLATTLGYLLSGANIKESEAERIGQAYVPTAFDSEAVKQQKIERARQLIQSYLATTDELGA